MAFGGSLAGSARVVLGVDTRDFNRDMQGAERQFSRSTREMDKNVGQLSRGVVAGSGALRGFARSVAFASASFLGAAGFTALVRQSVNAASDLNEAINRATVTFRGSAPEILKWSENAAHALGMSQRAALENASSIGAMLIPMGYARDNAAGMSKAMVQLAADLASINNQDPSEMLDRIRAGLAGETEPLRRFGVDLRQASVDAFALKQGLIEQGQTLSASGQLWARYQLLLKQTADAQGDYARTADGAANQQRTLRAAIEEAEAAVGKAFLPTIERLLPKLTGWADDLAHNEDAQQRLTDGVEKAVDVIGDMVTTVDDVAGALGGWQNTLEGIFALGVASKLAGMTRAFTLLAGTEATAAAAGGAAAAAGIGGAAGRSVLLLRYLRALSLIGVITIGVELVLHKDDVTDKLDRLNAWVERTTGAPLFGAPGGTTASKAGTGVALDAVTTGKTGELDFGTASGIVATGKTLGPGSGAVYVWGGDTIAEGYDCSGYLYDVYKRNGVAIPRDSRSQWNDPNAIHVAPGDELPGDGVYFVGSLGGVNAGLPPGHCGLYIGDGKFIQYFSSGKPAKTSDLSSRNDYMGARRWLKVVKQGGGAGSGGSGVSAPSDLVAASKAKKPKRKSTAKPDDPILAGLYLRLAQSEDTKRMTDDLKALHDIDVYLTKKIAVEKTVAEKTKLIKERQGIRGDITDVQTAIRDARPLPPAVRIPGLAAVLGQAGQLASGTTARDLGGGLGKVLVPHSLAPTVAAWGKLIVKLKLKLRAALGRRRALVGALQRLGRIHGRLRDPRMIQWHQQQIASLDKTIDEIRGAIGEAFAAQADIVAEATSKAQEAADEAERAEIARARADEEVAADDARVNAEAADAWQQALVATPVETRLALAQAEGTKGTADDIAALRTEEARLVGNLGRGNPETEVQIVNALNSVRSQIQRLIEGQDTLIDIEKNRDSFLQGLRALRGDQTNLYDPMAELRRSSLLVQNYYNSGPDDPHLWSKDLEFELKALVA
jgi:hypothetical protein